MLSNVICQQTTYSQNSNSSNNNNNNNNNNTKAITEVHPFYLVSAGLALDVVTILQCKLTDLGSESAGRYWHL